MLGEIGEGEAGIEEAGEDVADRVQELMGLGVGDLGVVAGIGDV